MFESILIVDGDVSFRDSFYEIFSSMGYKVTCVPNGSEALLRLERERPDLVLIDEGIPASHMDCFETMRKIREFDADLNYVLLCIDETDAEVNRKASDAGVLTVIKKDFSTHHMTKEILSLLKEHVHEIKKESRQGRIIVIDDESEIRNMISNFLTQKGYQVMTASTGEEALLAMKTQKFQLVLCDMRMPGMDGLMVLKKIRELDTEIKVVMLSALHDEDIVKDAIKQGASDYLAKPCSLAKLDALVLSILPH